MKSASLLACGIAILDISVWSVRLVKRRDSEGEEKAKEAKVDNDGDGLDDNFEMRCAEKFKPVTYLHSDEKYGPSTVEDYLRNCVVRKLHSCSRWTSLVEEEQGEQKSNASRANCPYSRSMGSRLPSCWFRDKDRTLGRATPELLGKYQNDGSVYLRCLGCHGTKCNDMGARRSEARGVLTTEGLRKVPYYVHVSPYTEGRIHIQYWFHYPFNGPTLGFGVHQGDWEHLAMLVDGTCSRRLQYRTSAHGGGDGWKKEVTGKVEYEHGAMVSYQAVNSHAGFMTEGSHEGGTIITRDKTNKGPRWFPDHLVNVGETTCSGGGRKPMSAATAFVDFGGKWGTVSAFDGVLTGLPKIGEICPGGPSWQFNKHTVFGCRR